MATDNRFYVEGSNVIDREGIFLGLKDFDFEDYTVDLLVHKVNIEKGGVEHWVIEKEPLLDYINFLAKEEGLELLNEKIALILVGSESSIDENFIEATTELQMMNSSYMRGQFSTYQSDLVEIDVSSSWNYYSNVLEIGNVKIQLSVWYAPSYGEFENHEMTIVFDKNYTEFQPKTLEEILEETGLSLSTETLSKINRLDERDKETLRNELNL